MTEPLEQFHEWFDKASGATVESKYVLAREAFYAGYRARPQQPIEPSREVLDRPVRPLSRYDRKPVERREQMRAAYMPAPGYPVEQIRPDYVQHGTITGRLPLTGQPTGPQRRLTREDTAVFTPAPGFEYAPPDPAVVKRVHEGLTERARDIGVGLEHVSTVWDGSEQPDPDETTQFGAPGRVRTAYELTDDGNG